MSKPAPPRVAPFDRALLALMAACVVGLYTLHLPVPTARYAEGRVVAAVAEPVSRGFRSWRFRQAGGRPGVDAAVRADSSEATAYQLEVSTASDLAALLDQFDYDLDRVIADGRPVPRVLLASLPGDLAEQKSTETRKSLFLSAVLPIVLLTNQEILRDRDRALALRAQIRDDKVLLPEDQLWLNHEYAKYRVPDGKIDLLVRRIDVIPPSLALAQAAKETGWGTSRFALEGNALFGQWTWSEEAGLVPEDREAGKTHAVRAFAHLLESTRAYALNLNSHPAYVRLRDIRARMRQDARAPDGMALSVALDRYAAIGMAYVDALRTIIRANALDRLDDARLGEPLLTASNG